MPIHTDGGSFSDAFAIHGNLLRREGKTHVIVDGKAYSGGSIVAMAGATITMAKGSWMMMHEARGGLREATADDFDEAASRLRAINQQLAEIYSKRWRGKRADLMAALKSEKWMRDTDAVSIGMADRVADDSLAIAAHVSGKAWGFKNAPEEIATAAPDAFPKLLSREAKVPALPSDSDLTKQADSA